MIAPASQEPIVIHPGFVKTATSTLQRHVFAKHPGIDFLGLPAPSPELEWAIRHICQADSIHYEPERLSRFLAQELERCDPGKVKLISYENFGLYESKDKGLVDQRLKALFPNAKVLFTIRRQEDLVTSWYLTKLRFRIKHKAYMPFEEWFWTEAREPWQSILDDLAFGRTIDLYADLFGKAQLQVVPYEWLKTDPGRFSHGIADFLGVDAAVFQALLATNRENASMSQAYLDFWRRFHHPLPRKAVRKWSMRMPMQRGPSALLQATSRTDPGSD